MSDEKISYKDWQSPLYLEELFAQPGKPTYLELKNETLYWMENNPEIRGVTQIKCRQSGGEVTTLTSPKLSVRTKANEYGGKAYVVGNDALYFCNDADQRIYRLPINHDFSPESEDSYDMLYDDDTFEESIFEALEDSSLIDEAQPITPDDGRMYADLQLSSNGKWLFFIMETPDEPENKTEIAIVSTQVGVNEPEVLASGCDFYASLVLSDDNQHIAWIEWRHPNMPWDETHVVIGQLKVDGNDLLKKPYILSLSNQLDSMISNIGSGATISHLKFEPRNPDMVLEETSQLQSQRLFMVIDWPNQSLGATRNYGQLHCWDGNALYEITQGVNEYSYPHWVFGNHRYTFMGYKKILAIATNPNGDELHLIDLKREKIVRLSNGFVHFSGICSENGIGFVVGESQQGAPQVLRVQGTQVAASASNQQLALTNISCAESLTIRVNDGSEQVTTYAYFYEPKNVHYSSSSQDDLPPLVVMVHGGPTSRAYSHFDLQKQFWTTSGFAVLDVNHRGSSGFGRKYRDELLGEWGVADMKDIKASIEHVIDKGLVHPEHIFIRGKSSGGYAVQRALTMFPELFAGGASYYGIGDLATLTEITHKFESRYCDQLLGEVYDSERAKLLKSAYYSRSPIHALHRLKSPMILFQGLDDKVVPSELSQQVADALEKNSIEYEYHTYLGEGHGFRGLNAKVDSITKELHFYRKLMQS